MMRKSVLEVGSTLVTLLLIFVIAYFLAVDERFAERVASRFFPPHLRPRALKIMERIGTGLGYWVRAQLLLMPEVDHVALVSGAHDILLRVRARDAVSLRDVVLTRLQEIPEVRATQTVRAMLRVR